MIISGIALYFYTSALLDNEIKEELYSNKDRVEQHLLKNPNFTGVPPIVTVSKVRETQSEQLKDTLLFDPFQNEVEEFMQLSGTKNINGQNYLVTLRVMVIESEDILSAILITFCIIVLLAFLLLFFLNKYRNQKLWQPFFTNLERLKTFSLKADEPLQLAESDIKEFDDLNTEMKLLTSKVQKDYRNLKQFTEDVSHEMQTPLAIMQAKIETIIDEQDINEAQFNKLSSLQSDIQRLKQLNKRLIMMAKIDNDQFVQNEKVLLNKVLQNVVLNFSELTKARLDLDESGEITVEMDKSLAFVLFNNLISNAVKHNWKDKEISIVINETSVSFFNAGKSQLSHTELIFERFYKESKKPDSTGLGLSIVKKICDYYGFKPSYHFQDKKHVFVINFNK